MKLGFLSFSSFFVHKCYCFTGYHAFRWSVWFWAFLVVPFKSYPRPIFQFYSQLHWHTFWFKNTFFQSFTSQVSSISSTFCTSWLFRWGSILFRKVCLLPPWENYFEQSEFESVGSIFTTTDDNVTRDSKCSRNVGKDWSNFGMSVSLCSWLVKVLSL